MTKFYVTNFLQYVEAIADSLQYDSYQQQIEDIISLLQHTKEVGGRLFIAGMGGSAATASHAANDFRKIANLPTYALWDNVAEVSAYGNDEGWGVALGQSLINNHVTNKDVLMVLSVSGGAGKKANTIIDVVEVAQDYGMSIISIVGNPDAEILHIATHPLVFPVLKKELSVPLTESFHSVILHAIVNDPRLVR